MRKPIATLLCILISTFLGQAQFLEKKWDHTYGGSGSDRTTGIIETSDGGFLVAGHSNSDSSFDVSETSRGGNDYWVVRTDSLGNKLWDKRFGGSIEENLWYIDETSDGGFVLGGFTASDSSGDISEPSKGSLDFWVVRIDASGNKIWDRRYGGSDYDWLNCVKQASDGGFILGGLTFSPVSGDVTDTSRGGEDFWFVKTDSAGNVLWDKRYGGNFADAIYDMEETPDGGYILGGRTSSDASGDVSQPNRGEADYWAVKTDAVGNLVWERRFGGTDKEEFYSLDLTSDGGYILGGNTLSDSSFEISEATRDTSLLLDNRGDNWLVKIDSLGNIQWDKRYGGVWVEDDFGYVTQTPDGGYFFGCASYSNISGEKSENNFGREQTWIVKIDSAGNKLWDKTIFNEGEEESGFTLYTMDGCYVVCNRSEGDSTGYKTENARGNYDYWFIKFCETAIPQLPVANFQASNPVICQSGCLSFYNLSMNSGTFQWEFPGASPSSSSSPFPQDICYSDTGHYDVTLIAFSPQGNDTITIQDAVYIAPLPDFTIVRIGDTLFAPNGFASYQWFMGSNALPGEDDYFYVATVSGTYSVQLADGFGCASADTISIINVGVPMISARYELSVFPNPTTGQLNVRSQKIQSGEGKIYDLSGRIMNEVRWSSGVPIDVSALHPGIYLLEISGGYYTRFVVQ